MNVDVKVALDVSIVRLPRRLKGNHSEKGETNFSDTPYNGRLVTDVNEDSRAG